MTFFGQSTACLCILFFLSCSSFYHPQILFGSMDAAAVIIKPSFQSIAWWKFDHTGFSLPILVHQSTKSGRQRHTHAFDGDAKTRCPKALFVLPQPTFLWIAQSLFRNQHFTCFYQFIGDGIDLLCNHLALCQVYRREGT